jgi:hypothetical protein
LNSNNLDVEHFETYSDDELIKIAYLHSEDYEPSAVSIAKGILTSRNVIVKDVIENVRNKELVERNYADDYDKTWKKRLNTFIKYVMLCIFIVLIDMFIAPKFGFHLLPYRSKPNSVSSENLRNPTLDDPAGYVVIDGIGLLRFPENPLVDTTVFDFGEGLINYIYHTYRDTDKGITYQFSYYPLSPSEMNTSHDIIMDNARDGGLNSSSSTLIKEEIVSRQQHIGRKSSASTANGRMTLLTETYIIKNQLCILLVVSPNLWSTKTSITNYFDTFKIIETLP